MTISRQPISSSTSIISGGSSSDSASKSTILPLVNSNYGADSSSIKARERANATTNLSIAGTSGDRLPKFSRKVPLKTLSLVDRRSSTGAILPQYDTTEDATAAFPKSSAEPSSPQKLKRNHFNASETGQGSLLPTTTTAKKSTMSSSSSYQESSSKSRTSSLNNMSSFLYSDSVNGLSRSRTMTESISSTLSFATGGGYMKGRGRHEEELPLHVQSSHYDDTIQSNNRSVEKQKVSLRSRRSRASTLDREDYDPNGGSTNGYASMDGSNHDHIKSLNGAGSGFGWLPWRSKSNTSTYPDLSPTHYKLGKRRNSPNSNQDYFLPLTVSPTLTCTNGLHRSTIIHSYVRKLLKSHWIQTLIVIVATTLVWHSYQRTQTIQTRLEIFNDKESMSLLHLKTVEQQLVYLHESVIRLNDVATNGNGDADQTSNNSNSNSNNQHPDSHGNGSKTGGAVDADLIRVQTQQLYQMEEELDHELRALQTKIQHVARSSIVSSYGEGPVQVILELDFRDVQHALPQDYNPDHNRISILLWYDTPHAAWTWLQQIRRGRWNDAFFRIGKGSLSINASQNEKYNTKEKDKDEKETLKFVEKSKKTHEPWTVGLTVTDNGMGMFINLQDNSIVRKKDVCVGKVIDGFDALQLLVDASRRLDGTDNSVTIKNAFATHLTRGQTQGLM